MENAQRIKKILVIITSVLAFSVGVATADVNDDIKDYYNSMGGNYTADSAKFYKGQSANYGTFGGVMSRAPVRTFNPLSLQLPSIRGGCGGIDLFLGGFSFINTDQFVQYLQAIGNNSIGFAFQLALDTISPEISKIISEMQAITSKANVANMNSCQAARELVRGAMQETDLRKSYCERALAKDGTASGYTQARYMCQEDSTIISSVEKIAPTDPDGGTFKGNLVWQGIKRLQMDNSNLDLANVIMSMTGTIVKDKKDGQDGTQYYPSLLRPSHLLSTDDGYTMSIYSCPKNSDCLVPDLAINTNFRPAAWNKSIRDMVESIKNKITNQTDEALTEEEKKLIASVDVPIYGLIQYAADTSPYLAEMLVREYTDYIISYTIKHYVEDASKHARAALSVRTMKDETTRKDAENMLEKIRIANYEADSVFNTLSKGMADTRRIMEQFNMFRSLAYEKYGPDMQKRMAFAKMLSKRR